MSYASRKQRTLVPTLPTQKHHTHLLNQWLLKDDKAGDEDYRITDVAYVASYNWLDRGSRTILVPGCPPRWSPPETTPKLSKDEGMFFRDQNASQYPSYPIEPAVRSILTMQPDFNGQTIDLLTCSNVFGSLLSFLLDNEKTFRFSAEKIGNTLFLVRRENSPSEIFDTGYGTGQSFRKTYIAYDEAYAGSKSHQRLIAFKMGGLCCVVRSEPDGFLPDMLPQDHPLRNATSGMGPVTGEHAVEKSASTTGSVPDPGKNDCNSTKPLKILEAGTEVPQDAIFDLKTQSLTTRYALQQSEIQERVWIYQVPKFILAEHDRGRFYRKDIQIQDTRAMMKGFEKYHQVQIRQLVYLIKMLSLIAEEKEGKRIEVRREGTEHLSVWSAREDERENAALPFELRRRWMGGPVSDE